MIGALFFTGLVFMFNMSGVIVLLGIFVCYMPHALSLGPLPWLMMSEIYPTRVRAKAVAITTTVLWIAGWSAPMFFPILMGFFERTTGSAGPAFWFFAVICVISIIFGLKFLPETKGRTLEEIGKSWLREKEPTNEKEAVQL